MTGTSRRWAVLGVVGVATALCLAFASRLADVHQTVQDRADGAVETAIAWGVVACFAYMILVFSLYFTLLAVAAAESLLRNRERHIESFGVLEESAFTIPVSIVATVFNEEPLVAASVRTLLDQDYPEHEVIVVDDGSTDGTFAQLESAFELEQHAVFVRTIVETEPIAGIYRSRHDARLTVVRKANGGKADALNCGLNLARYSYLVGVDGDTLYRREALLVGMRLVLRDPANVIGVTSTIAISVRPEHAHAEVPGKRTVDRSLVGNFQHLDYLRAFLTNRLAWSRLGFMLCTVGAFQIWRRDVLAEVGGFSRDFTCEDIEMTFRVHEKFLREGRSYSILCIPETVATTEGPDRIRALVKQRARWQRVIMETLVHYRHMFGNPRYGTVGLVGVPFYMVTEVAAPLFEAMALVILVASAVLGIISWPFYALMLGIMAFGAATLTSVAILLADRTARDYTLSSLARLLLVAPLDLFLYRPILMVARARGTWDFLRGRRDWDKFERNVRQTPVRAAGP